MLAYNINYQKMIEHVPLKEGNQIKLITRDSVLYNLSRYGYDLILVRIIKKHRILTVEELIIQILARFPEARFIEAIPTLILKNRIDKSELYRLAHNYGL